jgi:hypothetical protein
MNDLEQRLDELLDDYEIDDILEILAASCRWHELRKAQREASK